jgi:hypothetical protein
MYIAILSTLTSGWEFVRLLLQKIIPLKRLILAILSFEILYALMKVA